MIQSMRGDAADMSRRQGREMLEQAKWGARVHRNMQIPARAVRRLDCVVSEYGGIVDQAPDRPELALGARQQRGDSSLIGEIRGERNRRAAFTADQLGQSFSGIARAVVVNGDSETVIGERKGEGAADPLCAAGYQRRAWYRGNRQRSRRLVTRLGLTDG